MKHAICIGFFLIASSALAAPNFAGNQPMSPEECAKTWQTIMPDVPRSEHEKMCACIEREQAKSPTDPAKAEHLDGGDGLKNAGAWPDVFSKCLQPFFKKHKKNPHEHSVE